MEIPRAVEQWLTARIFYSVAMITCALYIFEAMRVVMRLVEKNI